MKNKFGIYCIKNLINRKVYVGQAVSFRKRFRDHKFRLNNDREVPNKHLQASWNKYGSDNFEFIILEYIEDPDKLTIEEDIWIELLDARNPKYGYNKREVAESNLGYKHTEETKKKMSIVHKGNKYNLGHKQTKEHKKKISKSLSGKNHYMYGKHHSEETRKKMSRIKKGVYQGENSPRAKLNDWKVRVIKQLLKFNSLSQREIAGLFSISQTTIHRINTGRTWGHI